MIKKYRNILIVSLVLIFLTNLFISILGAINNHGVSLLHIEISYALMIATMISYLFYKKIYTKIKNDEKVTLIDYYTPFVIQNTLLILFYIYFINKHHLDKEVITFYVTMYFIAIYIPNFILQSLSNLILYYYIKRNYFKD